MRFSRSTIFLATVALLSLGVPAQAVLVTDSAALGPATVIDFSQYDIGMYTRTHGPEQVGGLVGEDVVFTAVGPNPGFGGGGYGLVGNGSWNDPVGPGGRDGYAFIDNGGLYMDFKFDALVSGVGGFMNYCPTCPLGDAMIEVYGLGDILLESYNIELLAPISTPNGVNDGAFRGIVRNTADISSFRVWNRIAVLDDLTFARAEVPEPGTLALLGIGLVGMGLARRRRKL